jgi:hypothetical protein
MIDPMFPTMELPFDAYCFLLDKCIGEVKPFTPTTLEQDLQSGKLNAMVYWYPKLVLNLYSFAYEGLDFRGYLEALNEQNVYLFEQIFKDTCKKLDALREKKLNNNHLDEIIVKNGKLI